MKKYFHRNGRQIWYHSINWGLLLILLAALMLTGCSGTQTMAQTMTERRTDTAMGTIVSMTLYLTGDEEGAQTDALFDALEALETQTLSWRVDTSEVAVVNAAEGKEVHLSPELTQILSDCLAVSEASEGAFDVTLGRLTRLWDIDTWAGMEDRSDFAVPRQEEIDKALKTCGYEGMELIQTPDGGSIRLAEGMRLDLGAVGKGVALDVLLDRIEAQNLLTEQKRTDSTGEVQDASADSAVTGAVIAVGGSILTYGEKPDGSAWKVAITDPQEPAKTIGTLSLTGTHCVSTSGDYERYVEVDGVRYHHILTPQTGYPVEGELASVTVLTDSGLLSDALSTACYVLGEDAARRLLWSYDAEALFITHDGTITMTDGMQEIFTAN